MKTVLERYTYFENNFLAGNQASLLVVAEILSEINEKFEFIVDRIKRDEQQNNT